jgi:hypothetical protein
MEVQMAEEPSDREISWRDYATSADLYKFYLEILVKITAFNYGVTGALLSFVLTRREIGYGKWALLLPVLLSLCLAGIFAFSLPLAKNMRDNSYLLAEKLGIEAAHDYTPLLYSLRTLIFLKTLSAVGLIILLLHLVINE